MLRYPGVKDFVKLYWEGSKVIIVQRGGNRAGQVLELGVFHRGWLEWADFASKEAQREGMEPCY